MIGLIVGLTIFFSYIITIVLFFIINIKTVRRLRKNPITRDELGLHLFWGWYALNIAEALFFSKKWMTKRRNRPNGYLVANQELVHQYTTPFEKIICKLLVILGVFSVLSVLIFGLLSKMGFNILDY